ncbi:T9SS type B sorting domain-containing protein [Roseivirga echinicomitans]
MRKSLFIISFLLLAAVQAWATHLRAGEITAVRISQTSLKFRFTIVIYSDTGSGVQVADGGVLNFGQGRTIGSSGGGNRQKFIEAAVFFEEKFIGNNTALTIFQFEHTFDGPGVYVVSYTEQNRNNEILNINGGSSQEVPFHIETVLRIDPGLGINATPQLTIPPIDRGCIGARFVHNPGAYDPDGDSLAYRMIPLMQDRGVNVNGYVPLNDPSISTIREGGGSPARFEIDPITGDFTWDAPMVAGEYNAAFIVEEWRFSEITGKYELLGYVTRDMQILIEDCDNERPQLEIPADTCIVAGTLLEAVIRGTDPDNNKVMVEAFGGIFGLNPNAAQFIPEPAFKTQPVDQTFRWQTDLSHVRRRPYEIQFKVSDKPNDPQAPSLTDFATWYVTVVAPAPTGLNSAIANARSIQLTWDDYVGRNFNPMMKIYRKVDSYDFDPENCNIGIPEGSGYELIDQVPINQTNYVDTNNVRPGVNYCYRIVAEFPLPKGGTSYASIETCTIIPLDVPAITNVSVENTDISNGQMFVKWVSPLEIDKTLFPPPFRYELIRYDGLSGNGGRTLVTSTADTTFTDTGLNTRDKAYQYQVKFYDAGNNLIDSSSVASSVWLSALGLVQAVELTWQANVPWTNKVQEYPYHYIMRNRTDAAANDENNFVLIDSVKVTDTGFIYFDDGSFNNTALLDDREYCYIVTTQGSYGNDLIPAPLLNQSQKLCVQPNDNVAPEVPEIDVPVDAEEINGMIVLESPNCGDLENLGCAFSNFSNTLSWTANDIDGDIASYNIYFSPSGADGTFTLVGNSRTTTFTHTGLSSYKGCYRVSALDRSNNESSLSATVCFDNCPNYELPNTFTPNGDGLNDTFRAFDQPNGKCPRFVKSIEFKVFNRWGGKEIFSYSTQGKAEPNFFIDWNGRDSSGNELPEGTYYYHAIVTFDVFNPKKKTMEFKNWVKIVR